MTCSSFPNKPEPGLLDKELLRLRSAVGRVGASSQNPALVQLGRSGRFGKCGVLQPAEVLELKCVRSPSIPEELELLHARGEPDGCDGHQEETAAAAKSSSPVPNICASSWTNQPNALAWGGPFGFLVLT